jgi:hypothetical protein
MDFLAYNTTTGNLYYDADGSIGAAAVIIANLGAGTALAASDIYIQVVVL